MQTQAIQSTSVHHKKKIRWSTFFRYVLLTVIAFLMLYPIIWLLGASFKSNAEIFSSIGFWPKHFKFDAYVNGWKTGTEFTFGTYFINSFKIVIPKVIFTLISCSLTAYGFARFEFPYKNVLFGFVIATLFLPAVVTRIPMYILWKNLDLLDTYVPLIANTIFAQEPFFVFMMVQFMRGIPREYDEAAIIDGCNSFQVLIKILLPILKPALVNVTLFQFLWSINDFLTPLIYISSVEKYPISIALKMAMDTSGGVTPWNQIIAMSIIGLLPSIILFFLGSKQFMDGIQAGGIKG
ncbi:carbohydrate ABC transporter permease [Blautia liquoris]|uniref:Carbohydrate ABC transporter permease n=1 Tax=Blautia liquoris TaxID=2779518 RepID=A0A7M2RFY7_9FIRM|nr:carbohydrate ABC transporter permease [Blautia liquoris]QOV19179.1 carbohydrate ABC transporter permease [Blautia liquoris]